MYARACAVSQSRVTQSYVPSIDSWCFLVSILLPAGAAVVTFNASSPYISAVFAVVFIYAFA